MKEEATLISKKRNAAIDIIKGFLVLLMVFFHCASMAMDIYPDLRIVTKILSWLSFGFIMMSGFLCGWYYSPKAKSGKQSVRNRLNIRGLKLIVLFIVINLFLYSSQLMGVFDIAKLQNTVTSINSILDNYVLTMNGDLVGFQVVYYIGLFLLMISIIIDRIKLTAVIIITFFLIIITVYGRTFLYLSFGFIGYCLGLGLRYNFDKIFRKKTAILAIIIFTLILLHIICIDSIRLVTIQHPILMPIIYFFEIILWMLFAVQITHYISSNMFNTIIRYFGKYTLWGYISQMFIIRMGFIVISKLGISNWSYYFINVLISTLILYISIRFLDLIRKEYRIADHGYRFVFQ